MTKDFIFTCSTDVTTAQREVIQLEYQFNRRWSVSVTRDENGGVAGFLEPIVWREQARI